MGWKLCCMRPHYFVSLCTLEQNPRVNYKRFLPLLFLLCFSLQGQESEVYTEEESFVGPLNDKSSLGQMYFVEGLMNIAGYSIDFIEVYQTLPNHARIFRVLYDDEQQSGFIFIRWDKKKNENYVANKMIDPGVYYNLKAAKEIMREQTDKKEFLVDDAALQAPDQEKLTTDELEGLRQQYELDQEEKKLKELERANKKGRRRKN